MAVDPAFFPGRAGPFPLEELARTAEGTIEGAIKVGHLYSDVAPLDQAGPDDISFLDNPKYVDIFKASRAGVVILNPKFKDHAPAGMALILCAAPYKGYARVAQLFHPPSPTRPGRHASAFIDPLAFIDKDVEIGPGVVIEAEAQIGAGTIIAAHSYIGRAVRIGQACRIGPSCVVTHAIIGKNVTLHPGVKIGQDGFGFAPDAQGHVKVPQLGRVIIGDGCDIGANTSIDRGAGPDTEIGPGCWIDNLVQIGHNVKVGRGCVIVAQTGIAGSTQLADFVTVGAQVGIAGHLKIGAGARIGAQSGVMNDVNSGETVIGAPAVPIKKFFRQVAILQKLENKMQEGKK